MSAHTKGKWLVRQVGTNSGEWMEVYVDGPYFDDGSEFVVCELPAVKSKPTGKRWKATLDSEIHIANGKLITCAPEMANLLLSILRSGVFQIPIESLLKKAGVIE